MAELTAEQAFQIALQHHRAGRLAEAATIYEQILKVHPAHADSLQLLGVAFFQAGDPERGLLLIDRAIALQPNVAFYEMNRGQVLERLGRLEESAAATRRAIALDPNLPEAHNNLGAYLEKKHRLVEAAEAFRQALRVKPDYPEAHTNLGNVLKEQSELAAALVHYRQAVALRPQFSLLHSNLLLALHFQDELSPAQIAAEHRAWARQFQTGRLAGTPGGADPDRRLRLGFISPDFRDHPVARFLLPFLAHHDRTRFEICCYADSHYRDAITEEIQSWATTWRDATAWSDARLAQQVQEDRIDLLFDLAGHTSRSRLPVFAAKPAPVQISYLGYPDSTGLDTIDYRIVDAWSDPPGMTDPYCSEKLWRLSAGAWCYRPPAYAPPPVPSERLAAGAIHFGSFNTLAKLSPALLALWADILKALPISRLVLKAKALHDAAVRTALERRFAAQGIAAERLVLLPWTETVEAHLAQYAEVDIALDSFPYHGTTTTCDALWMGVPVVSLAGQMHHARVGVSLLHRVGLDWCVAETPAEYVRIATDLARDPEKLSALRAGLRARMSASSLRDERGFAAEFQTMLRAMWREHCQKVSV